MNNNSYEMATPINALQAQPQVQTQYQPNPNVNNLIKNIENNIENIGNVRNIQSSQPANANFQQQRMVQQPELVYNPNPIFRNEVVEKPQPVQQKKEVVNKQVNVKKPWHKRLLVNSKEYLIMVLLFSLLAHKKINKLLMTYIPYVGNFESPLPSLILRGFIFAVILFIIKHVI